MKDIVEIWDALKAGKKLKHVEPAYFKYIRLNENRKVVDQDGSAVDFLFTNTECWSIYEEPKVRIQVGDKVFEFAKPVDSALEMNKYYYVPDPGTDNKCFHSTWSGDRHDLGRLETGFIQLTKQDAIRQAECMEALFKQALSNC